MKRGGLELLIFSLCLMPVAHSNEDISMEIFEVSFDSAGKSDVIDLNIPPATNSFLFVIEGAETQTFQIDSLLTPKGDRWIDPALSFPDSMEFKRTKLTQAVPSMISPNRSLFQFVGAGFLLVPNSSTLVSPEGNLEPGVWKFRVSARIPTKDRVFRPGIGNAEVRVFRKSRTPETANHELRIRIFVSDGQPFTAKELKIGGLAYGLSIPFEAGGVRVIVDSIEQTSLPIKRATETATLGLLSQFGPYRGVTVLFVPRNHSDLSAGVAVGSSPGMDLTLPGGVVISTSAQSASEVNPSLVAHEVGHALGLFHNTAELPEPFSAPNIPDATQWENLMNPGYVSGDHRVLSPGQIEIIRRHICVRALK